MLLLGQAAVTGQDVANELASRGYTIILPPPPIPEPEPEPEPILIEPEPEPLPHVIPEPVPAKRPHWLFYAMIAAVGYFMLEEERRAKRRS